MFDTLRSRLVPLVAGTALFVGIVLSAMGYAALRTELRRNALDNLQHVTTSHASEMAARLDMLRRDAKVLGHTPDVRNAMYAIKGLDAGPEGLAAEVGWAAWQLDNLFATFIEEHPFVTQVRLIGPGERSPELVRVDRENGRAVAVPAPELQEKGEEPYMRAARGLSARQSYLSDVTLNREQGQVEADAPPTIRIVYAARTDSGEVGAYLVINSDFAALMDDALQGELGDHSVTIWTENGDALDLALGAAPAMRFGALPPDQVPAAGVSFDDEAVRHVKWIETASGRSFGVAASIPRSAFETASTQGLLSFLAAAFLLCAVAIGAAIWLARGLARPLEDLAIAVNAPRARLFELDLEETGYREVRLLSTSFRVVANALSEEARQAAWQATHDKLSGLLNRRGFEDALAERAAGPGEVTLIQFDLDRFKLVNDTLGHEAGDAVIAAVGERLKALLGPQDRAGRVGGDEFLLLREGAPAGEISAFAAEAIPALSAPVEHDGRLCRFGVSMGAAVGPAADLRNERLLKQADLALYKAKAEGRGRCQLFDQRMDRRRRDRAEMILALEDAVETGNIRVVYAPKVTVDWLGLVGFEALARWRRDDGTDVPPGEFLPVAEEAGLLGEIERQVFSTVAADIGGWRQTCPDVPTICVNASDLCLRSPDMISLIRGFGLPPRSIAIELQESGLLDAADAAIRWAIDGLKESGIGITIDNFGSGHGSILSLARIGPDWVNVDRALIQGVASELPIKLLVKSIVDMAIPLGAAVHAVGVETEAQAAALGAVGCGTMQGDLIGRPMDAPAVSLLLQASSSLSGAASSLRAAGGLG